MSGAAAGVDAKAPADRRTLRRQGWGLAGFVGFVVASVTLVGMIVEKYPRLSAEEKVLVGRWYVRGESRDHESCFVAIEEYRSDHTMTFTGRAFVRREDGGKTTWDLESEIQPMRMPNHWKIVGRECHWEREGGDPYAFVDRVRLFLRTKYWPRGDGLIESPAIVRLSGDDKEFEISSVGLKMPGVRVGEDFTLPDEPLPPAVALAGWSDDHRTTGAGEATTAE